MADWPPPPTYALPILVDPKTQEAQFNPIWLEWFLRLAQVLTAAGAGGGSIQHNLLGGLQGGQASQYYHLTSAEHTDVTSGASFKTIAVPGETDIVADSYSDTLNIESATADIVITTDAGTKTITLTFTGSALPPDGDYGDIVVSGSGTVWTVKTSVIRDAGRWEPISNMNPAAPELLFDAGTGDVLMGWVS